MTRGGSGQIGLLGSDWWRISEKLVKSRERIARDQWIPVVE